MLERLVSGPGLFSGCSLELRVGFGTLLRKGLQAIVYPSLNVNRSDLPGLTGFISSLSPSRF